MCRGRYEGGFFKAQLDFPPDFPNQPPVMTFKSQMWHPNVYEDGKVREQLLYEESSGRQGRQGWHSTELHGGRLLSGAEPEPGCPPWGWGAGVCQANSSAGPDANLALVHAPRVSRAVSRGSRVQVCISILHPPGEDQFNQQESAEERWRPILGVRRPSCWR